jgi:hypothetical protein
MAQRVAIAVGLYLLGVVALGFRTAAGWLATRRLERAARHVTDIDAMATLARISSAAGLKHLPRLLESGQILVPMTMSVTQPAVVVLKTGVLGRCKIRSGARA